MFGRAIKSISPIAAIHGKKQATKKRRAGREAGLQQEYAQATSPETIEKNRQAQTVKSNELARSYQKEDEAAEGRGAEKAAKFHAQEHPGLTQAHRQAMEESGTHNINKTLRGYGRQIAATQGRKGIRGGTAFAQKAALANLGNESARELHRDIEKQNAEEMRGNKAATFAIQQGERAGAALNRQQAASELQGGEQSARNRALEDYLMKGGKGLHKSKKSRALVRA